MANNIATQGLRPNLTVLLDLAPEEALARRQGANANKEDHFEEQVIDHLDFRKRVREGFLKLAAEEPSRWLVINANQSQEEIADIIWQRVSQLLTQEGG